MPEPWQDEELWRVVETHALPGEWIRLKYIFRDGTEQYVTFRPGTFTDENVELTGDYLATQTDLRRNRFRQYGPASPSPKVTTLTSLQTILLANFPPLNPSDGDTYWLILPASYDPIGGKPIRWLIVYDSGSSLWHVTGPALNAEVLTIESTNSQVYTDLATVGPSITVPRAGLYDIDYAAHSGDQGSNTQAWISPKIGAAATSDNDGVYLSLGTVGATVLAGQGGFVERNITTAGDIVKLQYRCDQVSFMNYRNRRLRLRARTIT